MKMALYDPFKVKWVGTGTDYLMNCKFVTHTLWFHQAQCIYIYIYIK